MLKNNMLNDSVLKVLIGITITVNAILMLVSILPDHDPILYGTIAKHIVLSNNWIDLVIENMDWLDKPHLPFWITAVSFKIFGVSSFSYMLPGFIFNLFGAYSTYLLAKHFFNKQVGLLALLFYVTAVHLMLSSIDVKAEAYLLGEITPACYCWVLYQESSTFKLKYLLLGAFGTALAIMTKGLFVLVTIFGGSVALWLYNVVMTRTQKLANTRPFYLDLLQPKWIIALGLSFLFIVPELIALYIQFDAHPEKVVFDQTHVSGIKWFFWDSQFGRFFNTGPITKHVDLSHYVFFVHTILWSFLPWSIAFIAALYQIIKSLCSVDIKISLQKKRAYIYLLGGFFPTFFLFSVSLFQLDHYTNIIIPFAAIICASWVYDIAYCKRDKEDISPTGVLVFNTQIVLSILFIVLAFILDILIFGRLPIVMFILIVGGFTVLILFAAKSRIFKAIVYPTLAINLVFILFTLINRDIYTEYDAGYKMAHYLSEQQTLPIIEYKINLPTLAFHSKDQFPRLESLPELIEQPKPYYLVIQREDLPEIKKYLGDYQIIFQTAGISFLTKPFKFIATSLSKSGIEPELSHYLVIRAE